MKAPTLASWVPLLWSGIYLIISLPPAPGYLNQTAFETVFNLSPKICIASSVTFIVGDFIDSYVLAKFKLLTNGRFLWIRVLCSGAIGVLVENTLFCIIVFYSSLSLNLIFRMIFVQFLIKISCELILLPLTYLVINFLKKSEKIDHFDKNTNFNPFSLKVSNTGEL